MRQGFSHLSDPADADAFLGQIRTVLAQGLRLTA